MGSAILKQCLHYKWPHSIIQNSEIKDPFYILGLIVHLGIFSSLLSFYAFLSKLCCIHKLQCHLSSSDILSCAFASLPLSTAPTVPSSPPNPPPSSSQHRQHIPLLRHKPCKTQLPRRNLPPLRPMPPSIHQGAPNTSGRSMRGSVANLWGSSRGARGASRRFGRAGKMQWRGWWGLRSM